MLRFLLIAAGLVSVQAYCANSCSGHGVCGKDDICTCYDSWTSPDCSKMQCPFGVSWVTHSQDVLQKLAVPSYPAGKHAYTECSSKGICDTETGFCKCFPGYGGKGCRRSVCPNSCSGHGICALDSAIKDTNYGRDGISNTQKQYWNADKTQQCICDAGFTGSDCSVRICPSGDDPESTCTRSAPFTDVQLVTAQRSAATDAQEIEQFFTLSFTDMFNSQYTTRPISFYDDASVVQQALQGLPNFVVPDVEVFKVFPLDKNGAAKCHTWYQKTFEEHGCAAQSDCDTLKTAMGLTESSLICGKRTHTCIETAKTRADCVAVTSGTAAVALPTKCVGFEPDGIYQSAADSKFYYGRRLSAADVACAKGVWTKPSTGRNMLWAKPCKTDKDCRTCGKWTQIRAGKCNKGFCSSRVTSFPTTACNQAAFLIKFSSQSTQGRQNLMTCNVGAYTNTDGHSPRYESGGITQCSVSKAGVPDVKSSKICFAGDKAPVVGSGTCGGNAYTLAELNQQVLATNMRYVLSEVPRNAAADTKKELEYSARTPSDQLYTTDEINRAPSAAFDELLPCSNQGKCNYKSGECACEDGFTGQSCEVQIKYV